MDAPLRELQPEEIERYDAEGVIHARDLFPEPWLGRMAEAVERYAARPSPFGDAVSLQDQGFTGDLFLWKLDADFRAWVFESPAARVAQQVLRSPAVRHFYDQLFVKQPGCPVPTPWHHDITFWPVDVESRALCSIWIAFDDVTPESSGLEFVRGSHRWPARFRAITPNHDPYMSESAFETPPDIDAERERHDIFSPRIQAGDCLIFNPHIVHGSPANTSLDTPRRAFSTRWAGEGVRYEDRPATMPLLWRHGLRDGDPLAGPLFPQVLPETRPEELSGPPPEAPDPELVRRALERARGARQRAAIR